MEMWHGTPPSDSAVGYRFLNVGDWSKPEETLDQNLQDRRLAVNLDQQSSKPSVIAEFVDASGVACGKREIPFLMVPVTPGWLPSKYRVDDPDIGGLLRMLAECNRRKGKAVRR
jgi:hypothetical protein